MAVKQLEKKERRLIGILIGLVLALVLSFFIIFPFLKSILTAVVIAYIFYPLYRWVLKRLAIPWLSSLLVTLVIILIVVIPLVFVVNSAASSVQNISKIKGVIDQELTAKQCIEDENVACTSLQKTLEKYQDNPRAKLIIETTISKIQTAVFTLSTQFIFAIPKVILSVFIIFFTVYYLLKDGVKVANFFKKALPLKDQHTKSLVKKFNNVIFAVVYGNFITAIVQGILAGIGYYLFGFEPLFILTMLTVIAATIPFIGPPIIWGPVVLFKLFEGLAMNDSLLIGQAIGMTIYGLVVVGLIDNFLKPRIIGDKSDVHPLVVFLGVVGGIALLGPIGLVYGPLILALTETIIKLIKRDDHEA